MYKRILAIATIFLSGCTSMGPIGQPQFLEMVSKTTGYGKETIKISSRVDWDQTNTDFCWFANVQVNIVLQRPFIKCTEEQFSNTNKISNFPTEKRPVDHSGVLLATESSLDFLHWDEKNSTYTKASSFPIANIEKIEMYRFGLFRQVRLTVKNADSKYYNFVLMKASGQQGDGAKAELLVEHIKKRAGKDLAVETF